MTDADKVINPQHFGNDPKKSSVSGLIWKSGFEFRITFG